MPNPFQLPSSKPLVADDITKIEPPTNIVGTELTLDQMTALLKKAGKLPDSLKENKKSKGRKKKAPTEEAEEVRLQPYPNAAKFLGSHPYLTELDQDDQRMLATMRDHDIEIAPSVLGVINFYTREGSTFTSVVKDIKAEYEYRGDGFLYYVHNHSYLDSCNISCRRLDKDMKPLRYED